MRIVLDDLNFFKTRTTFNEKSIPFRITVFRNAFSIANTGKWIFGESFTAMFLC